MRSITMVEYSGSTPEKCDHKIPLTSNYNLLKLYDITRFEPRTSRMLSEHANHFTMSR
jgi:hypothetical protein